MKVQIDLFSGRPNPSWDLTEAEVLELLNRIDSLPASTAADRPDGLGYRGLHVDRLLSELETDDSPSANPIVTIEIRDGVVKVVRRDGTVKNLNDIGRSVECWLLTVAQGQVDESIRQVALADLGRASP
jgi:hypothetical protein